MRGWKTCSLALLLWACDDGAAGFGLDFDTGTPLDVGGDGIAPPPDAGDIGVADLGPDADGGGCPADTWGLDGECLGACDLVERLGCEDQDGDCFATAEACPAAPVHDCDDGRPTSHPLAPEVCDGFDNDCDGDPDQGFEVGGDCDGCGGEGKLECSVADPTRTACSTDVGQSQSPSAEELEEICDGEDNDCDGRVDDACRFDLPDAERGMPAVCGERVLVVQEGALVEVSMTGAEPLVEAPVALPSCGVAGVAWIEPSDPCDSEAGLLACPRGHLKVQPADGEVRDVTGLAVVGPPLVDGEQVYWHALVGDTPVLSRQAMAGGGVESLYEGEPASDPTPVVGGRMAARFWTGGVPEVAVRHLETGQSIALLRPEGAPGAPTANAAWVVWPAGDPASLWVVDRADPRSGFQLTMRDGPQRAPKLDRDRLVWLDASTEPPTLRTFDLRTGEAREVARGDIAPDGFAVDAGTLVWVDGGQVYRDRAEPAE